MRRALRGRQLPDLGDPRDHRIEDDRLLDNRAAAAFLQVAPRTLYKWAAQGRVPVVRLGRAVRFRVSALRMLVHEHEEPATLPFGD